MRNGGTAPSGPLWLLRLGTLAMALVFRPCRVRRGTSSGQAVLDHRTGLPGLRSCSDRLGVRSLLADRRICRTDSAGP